MGEENDRFGEVQNPPQTSLKPTKKKVYEEPKTALKRF